MTAWLQQAAEIIQEALGAARDSHSSEARAQSLAAIASAQIDLAAASAALTQPEQDGPVLTASEWRQLAERSSGAAQVLHAIGGRFENVSSERVDELLTGAEPWTHALAAAIALRLQEPERSDPIGAQFSQGPWSELTEMDLVSSDFPDDPDRVILYMRRRRPQ
jgi:hypothetical protein